MPLKVTYYTDAPIDGVKKCFEQMLNQEIEFVIEPFSKGGQTQTDITIYNEEQPHGVRLPVGTFRVDKTGPHLYITYIHLIRE